MKIPGGNTMNLKSYAIFGAVMVVAVIVAMKFIKFEGKQDTATGIITLDPAISTSKKATI